MKLPYSVKLPMTIGLLLLGAAASTHAQESQKEQIDEATTQAKAWLALHPIRTR
ncbi:MAG: hypothetical protein M3R60_05760 [Pseudomonadota bacterium]|nr:hypothetical protein [Pseudomonadota bacterium]